MSNKIDMGQLPCNLREHVTRYPNRQTEVVILQCYKCTTDGYVEQDEKYMITVIGASYTHYVLDEDNGDVEMHISTKDEYDFEKKRYNLHQFRAEKFFSVQDSNKKLLEHFESGSKVYGNGHRFINEFCYNLYINKELPNFKGRLISKPDGFAHPFLMNDAFITGEIVVFGSSDSIHVVDDCHVKDYSYEHKTLTFDIETLMVDRTGRKIGNRIIQISLVYQVGKRVHRVIGITIGEAVQNE